MYTKLEDRGSVTKVDLEVSYPDGRVKKVTLSNDPADNLHNHHMLDELSGLLFSHSGDLPDVQAFLASMTDEKKTAAWEQIADGDDYKPSLVVLQRSGDVHIMCGGHKNGHIRVAAE
jgi:hypothetical protein